MIRHLTRDEIIDEVRDVVTKRGLAYGAPEDNFLRIARYWRVFFLNRYGLEIALTEGDVADLMDLVKSARLDNDPLHHDSRVDKAGYSVAGAAWASKVRAERDAPLPQ